MSRKALCDAIRADWPAIVERSRCDRSAIDALPKGTLRILGSSQKTELGERAGVLTGVAYLAPAVSSGRDVCPYSTPECEATCLGVHAGRMAMGSVKRSQLWKTALRFGAPTLFEALVLMDADVLARTAEGLGLTPAIRLDGTSDLGDAGALAPQRPNVHWYEYTKSDRRAWRWQLQKIRGKAPNLHVTLSHDGSNTATCIQHLEIGGNVAVVYDHAKGGPFPRFWHAFPTLDGDAHDARFLDPPRHVVALSWKGPRKLLQVAGSFATKGR